MTFTDDWTEDIPTDKNIYELVPSENGQDCPGNGSHENIEIRCDECDYFLFCFSDAAGVSFPVGVRSTEIIDPPQNKEALQ